MNGRKLSEAINFLVSIVAKEEIFFKDIHTLANEAGISAATLKRAKILSDVKSKKSGKDWVWYMEENQYISTESQLDLPINSNDIIEFTSAQAVVDLPKNIQHLDWSKITRIYLICGTSNFQGKFDSFAGRVPRILEDNLMDGDAFIFCNCIKTQISVLQWQGDGFAQYFKRSDYGQFPWPPKRDAHAVEITPKDLKMLLEYPRLMMRLSGKSTPRNLVL